MSFKECLHQSVKLYCILVTLITAAIFLIGTAFAPDARFGYASLITPFKFAALGILPTFVMISKKELSVVQFIVRKVIQLVIIEAEIMFCLQDLQAEGLLGYVAISVLVVFVLTNLISAYSDWLQAKKLTRDLQRLRQSVKIV